MIKLSSQLSLKPGDRLIHPIAGYPGARHHGIFLGTDNFGNEWVSENHKLKGTQIVKLNSYLAEYGQLENVIPFVGSQQELQLLVRRALLQAGKPYDLITNNCEHHANYVQNGIAQSKQVRNVIWGLIGLFMLATINE